MLIGQIAIMDNVIHVVLLDKNYVLYKIIFMIIIILELSNVIKVLLIYKKINVYENLNNNIYIYFFFILY